LKSDQVKRLRDLETENTRLRRAVSDLTLDKLTPRVRWFEERPGDQVKRLKDLETESTRLRRALSDLAGQGPNCEVRPLADSRHQTRRFRLMPLSQSFPKPRAQSFGARFHRVMLDIPG
jgi:hypothetical protein